LAARGVESSPIRSRVKDPNPDVTKAPRKGPIQFALNQVD